MKKTLVLLSALIIILVGCSREIPSNEESRVQEGVLGIRYDTVEKVTMQIADETVILKQCENTTPDFTLPTQFFDGTKFNNLGDHAFRGDETVVSVIIPDGYEYIGHYAFTECPNLKFVYIGKDVCYIGERAFTDCPKLERFEVSPANPYIYEKEGCILETSSGTLLATKGNIPEGTKRIGYCVFSGNSNLSNLDIPNSVETIGGLAFDKSSLTSVRLPDSIIEIETAAFSQCTQLKEIYIPNIETLGARIFYGIDGITINCEAESKPDGWDDKWLDGCTNYTVNWGVTREG